MGCFVVVKRQTHLTHIVRALHATSGFTSRLYSRKQKAHQDADDCNHHQQFNQRETKTSRASHLLFPRPKRPQTHKQRESFRSRTPPLFPRWNSGSIEMWLAEELRLKQGAQSLAGFLDPPYCY
jgi:hypothetical protein